MTPLKLAQGMTAELSDGHAAHVAWESVRRPENEIDAERRLAEEAEASGAQMKEWWDGWLYRSDLWRDEIGHESDNTEVDRASGSGLSAELCVWRRNERKDDEHQANL